MKNTWYIALDSADLHEGLHARVLAGERLVLFRDSFGTAHALADQCPHRGARLSDGTQQGDCIACPFHGWEFNGGGQCTRIPANGRAAPIPTGARVRSYPVQEAAGYVWVYLADPATAHDLGDSANSPFHTTTSPGAANPNGEEATVPPLDLPPELTDPAWRAVPFTARWNAHWTRVVESVLDVSHLPFVHPKTTGDVDPTVDGPEFTVTEKEICVIAKPFHPLLRTPLNEEDHREASTITLYFPNQLILRTHMASVNQMCTYLALTPTGDPDGDGEAQTLIYGLALRNFLPDMEMIDDIHFEHNVTVLDEDRPVVEGLRPKRPPLDIRAEQHVRSDAQQVRFRHMLKHALKRQHRQPPHPPST